MIFRGRVILTLRAQTWEDPGSGAQPGCTLELPGSLKMLIFISVPGDFNQYPKLKTTSLGSILREVCTGKGKKMTSI